MELPSVYPNRSTPITITEVCCEVDAGTTTINLRRDDGSPADMLVGDLTCATAIANGCTTTFATSQAALATGQQIDFVLVSNAAAKRVNVVVTYTVP